MDHKSISLNICIELGQFKICFDHSPYSYPLLKLSKSVQDLLKVVLQTSQGTTIQFHLRTRVATIHQDWSRKSSGLVNSCPPGVSRYINYIRLAVHHHRLRQVSQGYMASICSRFYADNSPAYFQPQPVQAIHYLITSEVGETYEHIFLPPARFWKRREVLFCGPLLSPPYPPSPRMFCFISQLLLKLAFWNLACAIYAKTILLKCF